MNKIVFTVFLTAVLTSLPSCISVTAQVVLPGEDTSWADEISSDREFDFGDVPLGSSAKHIFYLTNTTEKDIQIESVRASCGCTVPKLDNQLIGPGEKVPLEVSLRTKNFRGRRTSTIHVSFLQPKGQEIQYSVEVNIRNLIVEPETLEFHSVLAGTTVTKNLQVSRRGSPFWKINKVSSSTKSVVPTITGRKITGSEVTYSIECALTENKKTMQKAQLVIETNDTRQREFEIPVSIHTVLPIQVSSSKIDFKASRQGTAKTILLKSTEPNAIKTLTLDSSEYSAEEIKPAKKKTHLVRVTRRSETTGTATLTIQFADSDQTVEVAIVSGNVEKGSVKQPGK